MRWQVVRMVGCVVFIVAAFLNASVMAATPEQVDQAIKRGVAFVYSQQRNGHWEVTPTRGPGSDHSADAGQWGGRTALATYALLSAGESPNDPRIAEAVKFLREADIIGYYALGLRAQVWPLLPPTPENLKAAERDLRLNLAGMERKPGRPDTGLYDYILRDSPRIDMSVSQYGVLGVWAGAQMPRSEIPAWYWTTTEAAWLRTQDKKLGGWSYDSRGQGNHPTNASMTAAGVATLFITQDYLHADKGINCTGNTINRPIEDGIRFLTTQIPELVRRGSNINARLYTLYGVERIGVASGLKYFKDSDWFKLGSEFLVADQSNRGSWNYNGDVVGTSFALLFLSRGREPVVFNKIKYANLDRDGQAVEAAWNQRPRDTANIARFVGKQSERYLNWQIIDLSVGSVRDLFDAPVAYIAGSLPMRLPDADKEKLREYVERGGMLLFNADCDRKPFSKSAVDLMSELFPQYEARVLPATHPIFTNQQFQLENMRRKPRVTGVSNGVRELAIFLEEDMGRHWQLNDQTRRESFELATMIYQYAVDKEHANYKGRSHYVELDKDFPVTRTVRVARLQYPGNWNPEPGGWKQLAAVLRKSDKLDVFTEAIDLANPGLRGKLNEFHVAHLTGTDGIKLTPEMTADLKTFVANGGLLLIDAAGGASDFRTAIESQLGTIWPDAGPDGGAMLPMSHSIYAPQNNQAIQVRYRAYAIRSLVGQLTQPRLRALTLDERVGVIYSPEDLSAGITGNQIDGIMGYAPATATELVRRVLLYAIGEQGGPKPKVPTAVTPASP